MKKKIYPLLFVVLLLTTSAIVRTEETETVGTPYGVRDATGNPANIGEGNCTGCHAGTINSNGGSLTIVVKDAKGTPVSTYGFNELYTVDITVSKSSISTFGFDAEVVTANNTDAGVITPIDTTKIQTLLGDRSTNMTHRVPGKTTNSHTFSFAWKTPPADSGEVIIYAAGLAANGNGKNTGDFTYTGIKKLKAVSTDIKQSEKEMDGISIYPNPVYDFFHLSYHLKNTEMVNVDLYSLNGQKIQELLSVLNGSGFQEEVISVPATVKTGVYLLQISTTNSKRYERIFVKRPA